MYRLQDGLQCVSTFLSIHLISIQVHALDWEQVRHLRKRAVTLFGREDNVLPQLLLRDRPPSGTDASRGAEEAVAVRYTQAREVIGVLGVQCRRRPDDLSHGLLGEGVDGRHGGRAWCRAGGASVDLVPVVDGRRHSSQT